MKYITYREEYNGELCYFILQKAFPNFVGRVVNYPVEGALANAPIAGFNLWVTFAGRVDGNFLPSEKDILTQIEAIFFSMAEWYFANRIEPHYKKYLKFIINDSGSPK